MRVSRVLAVPVGAVLAVTALLAFSAAPALAGTKHSAGGEFGPPTLTKSRPAVDAAPLSANAPAPLSEGPSSTRRIKPPKPTISGFTSSQSTITTTNGVIILSALITNGSTCVFSAEKGVVSSLPVTVACSSGTISDTLTLPFNYTARPLKYKFRLTVNGLVGSKHAVAGVVVDGDDGSPKPMINPVVGTPYNAIGAQCCGATGSVQPVTGSGFAPNEDVVLTVNDEQVGQGVSDDAGNLNTTLTVPHLTYGQHNLDATGQTAGDQATSTLGVGGSIYYEWTESCTANTWTVIFNWEGEGLDASSYYDLTISNGQQFETQSDSSGSFTDGPFTATIPGGTTQTYNATGPLGGVVITFGGAPYTESFGTC
jgi:hypothetical protein